MVLRLENFHAGKMIVCSRLGGMQEMVEDGHTGLHFTAGDSADLAAKAAWAWSNPDQMRRMGREARRVFELK